MKPPSPSPKKRKEKKVEANSTDFLLQRNFELREQRAALMDEITMLKAKNAELEAEIASLRKSPPQSPYPNANPSPAAAPAPQAPEEKESGT